MKKEKMNEGLEYLLMDDVNKIAYFARRHKWSIPFVVCYEIIKTLLKKNDDIALKKGLDLIPQDKKNNKPYMFGLLCRMIFYRYAYEYRYVEYVMFDFDNLKHKQRIEYLSSYERFRIYGIMSDNESAGILKNKKKSYDLLGDFYKREMIVIKSFDDFVKFSLFVSNREKIVFKPLDANGGKGVKLINKQELNISIKEWFVSVINNGGGILEECIEQSKELAVFHPNSVNSVRLITYNNGADVSLITAILRCGMKGSFVDNTSSGGIACAIDLNNGDLISDGYCKNGLRCEYHPDTGVRFKDFSIPKWNELLETVNKAAMLLPNQRIIGWDFAYSNDSWVIIEANAAPSMFTSQVCNHEGLKPQLEKTVFVDLPNGKLYANGKL